jgi:hypothetical protein
LNVDAGPVPGEYDLNQAPDREPVGTL